MAKKQNLPTPITREEQYLYAIATKGGGGGGGTDDYEELENLPQINGVELKGNKSSNDLGIEKIQFSTMPEASATYEGQIVQFIGTTDTYTNGYYYKCVEDGGVYSWEVKKVQADTSLQPKTLATPVSVGGASKTTVEQALEALASQDDGWTSTAQVDSSNTVTFTGLSDIYGYALYAEDKVVGITSVTKTGSGSNVTLAYVLSGASAGDVCKLRILK